MDLLHRVEKARGRRVLSALSGGADSVALTLLLIKAGAEVTCAHFEHGIRGADSLRDRDFCRAFCKELHVPLLEDSARVPENRMPGEGLEQAARRLRYRFLRRAKESVGAEWIALAHHMDDQAETVLMHLLRGSGLAGVAGMRELSGDLYRPLLSVRKRELLEYLEGLGQNYCRDASNWVPDTPRNLLRLRVMPELESVYPGCVEAIARFSAQADRDEAFFDALAEDWLSARMETGAYGLRIFAQDPGAHAYWTLRAARSNFPGADLPSGREIGCISPPSLRRPSRYGSFSRGKANCPACAGFLRRIGKAAPCGTIPSGRRSPVTRSRARFCAPGGREIGFNPWEWREKSSSQIT